MLPMYRILLIACAIVLSGSRVPAQVIIEEKITTDTVDIFKKEEERVKHASSAKWAALASLVLPGAGHQIIGDNKKAMVYFATEAVLLCGTIFCERFSTRLLGDSRNYAWQYAQTVCNKDPDDEYWKNIGDKYFKSSKEYNYVMELNRQFDRKYVQPEEQWYWEDESYQTTYRDIRANATRFHIAATFLIGGMILDRVISFIDVRITSKRKTFETATLDLNVRPYYSLSSKQVGILVQKQF